MKVALAVWLGVCFLLQVQGKTVLVEVFAKEVPLDETHPPSELTTDITFDAGTFVRRTKTLPSGNTFDGLGTDIGKAEFSGSRLPKSVSVVIYERDATASDHDGLCNLFIETKFGRRPTILRCIRESENGRHTNGIFFVRVSVT